MTLTRLPRRQAVRHSRTAVIYTRVSEDDSRRRQSVGQQEAECAEVAADGGWRVAAVFQDNDRSASRYASKAREEYARLLEHLAVADVDVLILWESSRGGRELEGWAALLNLCRRRGVRIHVVTHRRTYDLDNPRDWRTLAEDGVDSAYESEKTRERILRHVRHNASEGRPHGKLLYGYRRVYDDRGAYVEQVEHPEQADIVREIARRVREGEALYGIAKDLAARQVPAPGQPGNQWDPTQIRRMVTNPAYIGQRVHRGQVVGQARWPAIVDAQTFTECVARVSDPRRRTVRDTAVKHFLTGVLRCGICGSGVRIQNKGSYLAYICGGRFCVAIKTSDVDDFVTKTVVKRLSRPDMLDLLAAPSADAAQANTQLAELRARMDGFYLSAADGKISPTGLAAIEAQLLPEIEAAESRVRVAPVPQLLRGLVGPGAASRWEQLTIYQRREVVSWIVDLRLSPGRRGSRTFDPGRLGTSRWIGDSRTWADIAADGR